MASSRKDFDLADVGHYAWWHLGVNLGSRFCHIQAALREPSSGHDTRYRSNAISLQSVAARSARIRQFPAAASRADDDAPGLLADRHRLEDALVCDVDHGDVI